jgi:hypothetical protein
MGVRAQLALNQINSSGDLIGGPNAAGQIGDYLFRNNLIEVIVTGIGHTSQYTNTGGHIIDIDNLSGSGDRFNCLFTYFDNNFPDQADYSTATIINNGSNGQPAILRLTGVYSENSQIAVTTDYTLDLDQNFITVTTKLVNHSSSALNDFGLGDAVQWGSTDHFAPGYGYDLSGQTTTQPWLGGSSGDISYAYTTPSGTTTGPHGAAWSDPVATNADIPAGDSVSYTRYLTVGTGDLASAVDVVYALRGEETGLLDGRIVDDGTSQGLAGVAIDVSTNTGLPYSLIRTNGSGNYSAFLPQGNYHLVVSKDNYVSQEWDILIINNRTLTMNLRLVYSGGGGGDYPIGDTLTYILRPLSNIPTIVKRDSMLTIQATADPGITGWTAGLVFEDLSYDLPLLNAVYDTGLQRWFIDFGLPTNAPVELYDLWLAAPGIIDTVKNAVKIIDDYKTDYYFIQITDTHLPTNMYYYEPGAQQDTSNMADVWSLIKDFNVINPEFVFHTGDLVNEGELEDYLGLRYFSRAQRLLENFDMPVYVGAGNHDIGGWLETPVADGTARQDWWRFFGWKYLNQTSGDGPFNQDYYFDYGNTRYIDLEAYDNYDSWRYEIYGPSSFTSQQLVWLNNLIGATDPSKWIVTLIHYDFLDQFNLTTMGIDMNLWGHIHSDQGSIYTQPYDLSTNNVCNGERSFRVVKVDSQGLHPQLTMSSGSNGQNFTIGYSPANDGTHDSVTATIVNNYNFTFNHGQVVFRMPGASSYNVTNGQLWQRITHSDSTVSCYVEVSLTANATTTVTCEVGTPYFLPGDANGDGRLIGSDVTYLVQYFAGRNPAPDPFYAGDANGDCEIIGSDVTYLVTYFRGIGPAPVAGDCP